MREVELKAVLDDWEGRRERLLENGGRLVFVGQLEDRRYDTPERALAARDHVLRLRVYRDAGAARGSLDWKGPTTLDGEYKVREERTTSIANPDEIAAILERLGYLETLRVDREIVQFQVHGATVRFERYAAMDDLVEVEGEPAAIERAIESLGLPRSAFTGERLRDFIARFEERTGKGAALSEAEAEGLTRHRREDA